MAVEPVQRVSKDSAEGTGLSRSVATTIGRAASPADSIASRVRVSKRREVRMADGAQSVILNQVSYGIAVRMAVMAMAMSGQQQEKNERNGEGA